MIIYKVVNKINGKVYVGQDKNNNPSYMGSGKRLKDAIKCYGIENFEKIILETCNNINELNSKEMEWIVKLNSMIPNGYNMTEGGTGGDTFSKRSICSQDITRKKLSKNQLYKSQDSEYIKKLSNIGKNLWKDQKYVSRVKNAHSKAVQSAEFRQKMSIVMKNTIQNKLDVWSNCKKGSKNGRWLGKIELYDPDNVLIKTYESAVDMHNDTGIGAQLIRNNAKNNLPFIRGKYKKHTVRFKL